MYKAIKSISFDVEGDNFSNRWSVTELAIFFDIIKKKSAIVVKIFTFFHI